MKQHLLCKVEKKGFQWKNIEVHLAASHKLGYGWIIHGEKYHEGTPLGIDRM